MFCLVPVYKRSILGQGIQFICSYTKVWSSITNELGSRDVDILSNILFQRKFDMSNI